jgi:hypothetical protein
MCLWKGLWDPAFPPTFWLNIWALALTYLPTMIPALEAQMESPDLTLEPSELWAEMILSLLHKKPVSGVLWWWFRSDQHNHLGIITLQSMKMTYFSTDGSWWLDLQFFGIMVMQKWYTFSGNCSWDFEFWTFPRIAICSWILSFHSRQQQQTACHSTWDHKGTSDTLQRAVLLSRMCGRLSVEKCIFNL